MKRFYSHGKLLITGEYAVLEGALALGIPTKFGQSLEVAEGSEDVIHWRSYDENNLIWFETKFTHKNNQLLAIENTSSSTTKRLLQILSAAMTLNPNFLSALKNLSVTTKTEFPKNWGLGTSSTLINNIANWANVNPYLLLERTFGGSGYDIACAQHQTAITYQLQQEKRAVNEVLFYPEFHDSLYFVHLNEKRNSRDAILLFKKNKSNDVNSLLNKLNNVTQSIIENLDNFASFCDSLDRHEQLISELINEPPIKASKFYDFTGSIKSLGAWGGDFVLVASEEDPTPYFTNKGFKTIIKFSDMIL